MHLKGSTRLVGTPGLRVDRDWPARYSSRNSVARRPQRAGGARVSGTHDCHRRHSAVVERLHEYVGGGHEPQIPRRAV